MSKKGETPLIGEDGEVRELTRKDFERAIRFQDLLKDMQATIAARRRGPQRAPTKESTTIRLSPQVLEHFKAGGEGWQTRIDAALVDHVSRETGKAPMSAVVAAHARAKAPARHVYKAARKAAAGKGVAKKTTGRKGSKTKR